MQAKDSKRVLIVDDDALLRSLCGLALRPGGYELVEMASGEEALAGFATANADIVLLDVQMDGIDGYETCRRLRRLPGGDSVPVIMLTGLDDAGSIERAYEAGATDFIAKPFQWPLLTQRVRYALRASALTDASRQAAASLARAQEMAQLGSWSMAIDGSTQCSGQMLAILGITAGEATARGLLALVEEADRPRIEAMRHELATLGKGYDAVYMVRRADGMLRTVFEQAVMVCDVRGNALRMEGITQDITDRVEAERRIQRLSSHDVLTSLPNRDYFQKLLAAGLERASGSHGRSAVLQLDIERFKGVNDALGITAGDVVLKTVAGRLCVALHAGEDGTSPGGNAVGRVGGNAFALFIANAPDASEVSALAQRVLQAVAVPIRVGDREIQLNARMGIALHPRDSSQSHTLLACAEQALHVAKGTMGGSILFYDASISAAASSQLTVETDLRHALASGEEMRMYLQPKVDVRSGVVCGAEALIRWQHPSRGLVSPAEFIPVAERTGLVGSMTDWMMEQACRQVAAWKSTGVDPVPLSVNISASCFIHPSLVERIDVLLERYQVQGEFLVLEVTESMLVSDIGQCIERMRALRQRGVAVSLDDFGTGYSSLGYLKELPLDEIKLDRAFVTDIGRSRRDLALAASIMTLAQTLELGVIAEGVETEVQAAALKSIGCHLHQGYLYGKPVPAATFTDLLPKSRRDAAACVA